MGGNLHHAKAFIFDVDGTLLDYEQVSHEAFEMFLTQFGACLDWSLHRSFIGTPAEFWAPLIVEKLNLHQKTTAKELEQAYFENVETLLHKVTDMPGAYKFIQEVKEMGFRVGIATSAKGSSHSSKIGYHPEIAKVVDISVCGDDSEVLKGKPNPDIFLVAAKRLGVEPNQCVVVEDAVLGVKAAKAAGMKCIAVVDKRYYDTQENHSADWVVSTLEGFDVKATFTLKE
eukprot:Filipodium_phascolosomae@DN453_c0_g1_i1.p1